MAFSLNDFIEIKKIGQGGIGNIYLATQVSLGRRVVIKTLGMNLQNDPRLVKQFENEAKSAAALDHENIIKIYDFGESGGSFFITMEYVDGWELEQVMHVRPFPREIGIMVLLKALKGLRFAHQHGTVHSNFKPANIMLSKTGSVKIADFGLAYAKFKTLDFNGPAGGRTQPDYLPPEVVSGSQTHEVSRDMWSAGVAAYRLIGGELPFAGNDARSTAYAIVNDKEKEIRSLYPALPDECAAAIHACLRKDPVQRPVSLDPMIETFGNYLYEIGVRDNDGMVVSYIQDRNKVAADLTTMVARYRRHKTNAGILHPAGPRSSGHGIPAAAVRSKRFSLKKEAAVLGIIAVILLGSGAAMNVVRKNQDGQNLAISMPQGASQADHLASSLLTDPARNDQPKEGLPEYAALEHALIAVPGYAGKPDKRPPPESKIKKRIPLQGPAPAEGIPAPDPNEIFSFEQISSRQVEKKPGFLHVYSYPWADVYIDGAFEGTTPTPKPLPLPEGRHTVVLKRDGYKPYTTTVQIAGTDVARLRIQLERTTQTAAAAGQSASE